MICKYTVICLMALIVLFLIHLLIIKINYADESVTRSRKEFTSDGSAKNGLYSDEDKVTRLTTFNFNEKVYNSSSAWIVQFYNAWCGHCIKFSPIWKKLAADIHSWKDVVTIAAINCADDVNTQHCRDYEIMGYPTIRYFKPYTANFTIGEEFPHHENVDSLRHAVVTTLETIEKDGVPAGWPDLLLIRDNDALWKDRGKQLLLFWNDPYKQLMLLVIENEPSFVGSELILDLKNSPNVTVKRILDSTYGNAVAATTVFVFPRPKEGEPEPSKPVNMPIDLTDRRTIFKSVRSFLAPLQIDVLNVFSESDAQKELKQLVKQTAQQLKLANTVNANDLNMALWYSLFHEVPLQSSISTEKIAALSNYLRVLIKYLPGDDVTRTSWLETVAGQLPAYENISGSQLKRMVRQYGRQFESRPRAWVSCRGSDSTFRGYPCGLWMLFHTLTTHEYVASRDKPAAAGSETLDAMVPYIRHFFGCADCADHFAKMARTIAGNVSTPEDAVMWLWRAHNTVNARLAGDGSEDPAFPKVQFPSSVVCPKCRDADGLWYYPQVLDYLVRMYTNVQRYDDDDAAVVAARLHADGGTSENVAAAKGWTLGLSDMRTCIGLYVLCAGLLTVYTVRFFVKRNPRNRTSKYDFTNKA